MSRLSRAHNDAGLASTSGARRGGPGPLTSGVIPGIMVTKMESFHGMAASVVVMVSLSVVASVSGFVFPRTPFSPVQNGNMLLRPRSDSAVVDTLRRRSRMLGLASLSARMQRSRRIGNTLRGRRISAGAERGVRGPLSAARDKDSGNEGAGTSSSNKKEAQPVVFAQAALDKAWRSKRRIALQGKAKPLGTRFLSALGARPAVFVDDRDFMESTLDNVVRVSCILHTCVFCCTSNIM